MSTRKGRSFTRVDRSAGGLLNRSVALLQNRSSALQDLDNDLGLGTSLTLTCHLHHLPESVVLEDYHGAVTLLAQPVGNLARRAEAFLRESRGSKTAPSTLCLQHKIPYALAKKIVAEENPNLAEACGDYLSDFRQRTQHQTDKRKTSESTTASKRMKTASPSSAGESLLL